MRARDYFYSLVTDQRRGFIASLINIFLLFCSFLYGLAVTIASFGYKLCILRSYRPKCKVISVGNITWGGTGKTPMIEALAKFLKDKGHKVAILSRGYKRNKDTEDKGVGNLGDESCLLVKKMPDIPVLVGRNRIANAKKAISGYNVDTIILDDGFQHWRIKRDIDIVMIDSLSPFGNGYVLPRGILREPLKSLKRAQIFILTKTDLNTKGLVCLKDILRKINAKALILESIHKPLGFYNLQKEELPLSFIENKNICIVSGIADPESFEKMILQLGANIALRFCFPDHHKYTNNDIKNISDNCRRLSVDYVVITEKDAVKLELFPNIKDLLPVIIVMPIKLEIIQDKVFYDRLLSLYRS